MKKYLSLIIILFLSGAYVPAATAQINAPSAQFATAEDIAIAFYKTGDLVPNFENWITSQKPYSETAFARRPKIMKEELLRLNTAYENFNPALSQIKIKTSAFVTPHVSDNKDGTKNYSVTIDLDEHKNAVFYLPYVFMGQNIMVIPYKLEVLDSIEISDYTYNHIKSLIKQGEKYPFILRLRPAKSDLTAPHLIDGVDQWAFYTDITTLESWTADGRLIWEYSAPWYVSPKQQEIKDLYDIKPVNDNLGEGAIKVFSE